MSKQCKSYVHPGTEKVGKRCQLDENHEGNHDPHAHRGVPQEVQDACQNLRAEQVKMGECNPASRAFLASVARQNAETEVILKYLEEQIKKEK